MKRILILIALFLFCLPAFATRFPLPQKGDDVVGETFITRASSGESLNEIGERYGLGLHEMLEANPHIAQETLYGGEQVIIPNEFVLPKFRNGIVINVAECRLYYFTSSEVFTYPVGLGRKGWRTPTASTSVIKKATDPVWTVPKTIRAYVLHETGKYLPNSIPPGPENPLGPYAMYLGKTGYIIHGTNQPWSIGKLISAGCIRMYNQDVAELFQHVKVGTPVKIVHFPYKAGWNHGRLYLEAHRPVNLDEAPNSLNMIHITAVLKSAIRQNTALNQDRLMEVLRRNNGIPEMIGFDMAVRNPFFEKTNYSFADFTNFTDDELPQ